MDLATQSIRGPIRRIPPDKLVGVATLSEGSRAVVVIPSGMLSWPLYLLRTQHISHALIAWRTPGRFSGADGQRLANGWDNRPSIDEPLPGWMMEQFSWWQDASHGRTDTFNPMLLSTPIPTDYWLSLLASMNHVPFSSQYIAWLERTDIELRLRDQDGYGDAPLAELDDVRDVEHDWSRRHHGSRAPRIV